MEEGFGGRLSGTMHTPRGTARRMSVDHETPPSWSQHARDSSTTKAIVQSRSRQVSRPCTNSSRQTSPPRSEADQQDANANSDLEQRMLDIFNEIYEEDSEEENAYFFAPPHAPITKQSLSELDIGSIINNSKLRHDVNFDRELHFRPNMDGDRGLKKRTSQMQYWQAICVELHLIFHTLQSRLEDSVKAELVAGCSRRLKPMFENIKDILKNLVPERDQADVEEHMDVRMIMQEISRGVCDFVSISAWMAQLLKRHCAPMRDDLVDKMVDKISVQTPEMIAGGLSDLFQVLEAMKLVGSHEETSVDCQ